jgi:transposase
MSLRPTLMATVARAAFPRGNPNLHLRDRFGRIFSDAQFAPLFASCGQPAECPWRLALVTLLQFGENLAGRPMPFAAASTGSTCSAWS